MKAQMSLEMLAYLSLAGISMLYSIATVSTYSARMTRYVSAYEYSGFVQSISIAIMQSAQSITLYVPQGMCNSTVSGSNLDTGYGNFTFPMRIEIPDEILCAGATIQARISYVNGTAVLGD